MPSLHLRHDARPLTLLLIVGAGICMGMGVALRLLLPDVWDPLWIRVGVSAGAVVLAGLAHGKHLHHVVQPGLRMLAWVASAWVILLLWGNGFPPGVSTGVLATQVLCLVLFPSLWEALAYTLLLAIGVVAAGVASGADPLNYGGLTTTVVAMGVIVAVATWQRLGLAAALIRARDKLEEDVAERTHDLRKEVTERRNAELRAQQSSEAKSRFLANMSHELRTPLNAILGYSELVEESVVAGDVSTNEVCTDLQAIQRSGRHLLALVDDVLDLSRIEAGSLDLEPQQVDLASLVQRAVETVKPLADVKGLDMRIDAEGLPTSHIDPRRAYQVVTNLLSNAVKFTDAGLVRVAARRLDDSVVIEVCDTGIGIAEADLGRLFTPFAQLDDTSTRVAGGTGLGLALSRDLAQKMGGDITVRSELGEGSCFSLVLPLRAVA